MYSIFILNILHQQTVQHKYLLKHHLSAQLDGEQKRFTTDGSLTASKIVNIAPYTGSIDGNPEKTLTTPYDGLTIAVLNEEWQVIQEKAK
jgi:hypothetical protein